MTKTKTTTPKKVEAENIGPCDCCGTVGPRHEVPHAQPENPKVWLYDDRCKAAHDADIAVQNQLQSVGRQQMLGPDVIEGTVE